VIPFEVRVGRKTLSTVFGKYLNDEVLFEFFLPKRKFDFSDTSAHEDFFAADAAATTVLYKLDTSAFRV
jgi:hypothetical protein